MTALSLNGAQGELRTHTHKDGNQAALPIGLPGREMAETVGFEPTEDKGTLDPYRLSGGCFQPGSATSPHQGQSSISYRRLPSILFKLS